MDVSIPDRNQGLTDGLPQVYGFGRDTAISAGVFGSPGAKRLFVDPAHPQATDLGNTGENQTTPLATMARALNLIRPYRGDTVFVGSNDAWQYAAGLRVPPIQESLVIPATLGGFRICGVGPEPLAQCWEAANAGEFCITNYAMDVLIEGFCFTGNYSHACDGIYAEWDGATLFGENLTVRHCMFDDGIDTAIQLEYTWQCQIYSNWFLECDEYGVYLDPAGSGISYGAIHHNWFQEIGICALSLAGSERSEIAFNTVFNDNAQAGAVATDEGIITTGGRLNTVHHNTLSCLLPVPANGDYDDFCTAAATDAWIQNYLMDGPSVTNPT